MPDRLKLPFTFDTHLLSEDLDQLGQQWTQHYNRENYSGSWQAIPLRSPCGETDASRMIQADPTQKIFVDTTCLQNTLYFQQVLSSFESTIFAARLMRLTAGSVIKEHTDDGLRFEDGVVRIHIPIRTNSEVDFFLNGSRVEMMPGNCWYLRLSDPHQVRNRGKTDRIHLVIDMKVNGWLTKLFRAAKNSRNSNGT
ncbi:MAG: aspartyl/asparaginyl beta-hydroxylase domain-containing protein [Zavarzinella sp.]